MKASLTKEDEAAFYKYATNNLPNKQTTITPKN
jgi:hypothetical protein